MISSLLKRQHQVIIAAIKAGRVEDLIRYSSKQDEPEKKAVPAPAPKPASKSRTTGERAATRASGSLKRPSAPLPERVNTPKPAIPAVAPPVIPSIPIAKRDTGILDLDQVMSDYIKRNSEEGK